jgi:hypothetical protein
MKHITLESAAFYRTSIRSSASCCTPTEEKQAAGCTEEKQAAGCTEEKQAAARCPARA